MYHLEGQVCVVAGASSGIGREIALELSRGGAKVICTARRKENLKETMELILAEGGIGEAYPCDFLKGEEVEVLAQYVMDQYGKIDLWMNAIGVNNAMGITWDIGFDDWMLEVQGNLQTCYHGTKCAINQMKKQGYGRIINMAGGGVIRPETYNSAYACSKTAVVRFTECVTLELKAENMPIKVFAFEPGLITTQRTIDLAHNPDTARFMPGIIAPILEGRTTPISKPAKYIAFIATGAVDQLEGCFLASFMDQEKLVSEMDEIVENGLYKINVKGSSK
ncbi:MAG: SDR family oxidoreductase [Lachnospiraceae bacterium]